MEVYEPAQPASRYVGYFLQRTPASRVVENISVLTVVRLPLQHLLMRTCVDRRAQESQAAVLAAAMEAQSAKTPTANDDFATVWPHGWQSQATDLERTVIERAR